MTELKFSPWAKWDNRVSKLEEHMQYPGIYVLCISEQNMEERPFEWMEEIVYVGMTNSAAGLKGRLSQFDSTLRSSREAGPRHGGADRFRGAYSDGKVPVNQLYVAICRYECNVRDVTPENLRIQGQVAMAEYLAFAEYFKRFKKMPKYNNKKDSKKYSKTSKVQ